MPNSSKSTSVGRIPVKVIAAKPAQPVFHWKRRAVQALTILLAVLVPATGLLRIDPEAGALVVVDRQIWFSDFFLISGLWITLASCLVMLYSAAGTVFCGWVCPQNSLAEWANNLTHQLLGKRADVSLDGSGRVAATKNKLVNWLMLGLAFLAAAMFFALIPLFYFYPPTTIWHFATFQHDAGLAASLHWIYTVCVLIIFLDIAMLRHFWCRFSCIYRVWQHSFKTQQTLHVTYDAARSSECVKCNYCATTCFLGLDPRKTEVFDSCINCGECIDACNRLHDKEGAPGLLRFEMGERVQKQLTGFRTAAVSLLGRTKWASTFTTLGVLMFVWGLWSYEPYHVAVGRAEMQQAKTTQDYRIAVANKFYHPAAFNVQVQGLPPGTYHLSSDAMTLSPAGRGSVTLSVSPELPRGLYGITITVSALDGWAGTFHIQHFSEQR